MRMSPVPVEGVFMDSRALRASGEHEFTIDCGAVYFGAVYTPDGTLMFVDQYFFSEGFSRGDMAAAQAAADLLAVDGADFPARTFLLTKEEGGSEWLRFHAVVPERIDPAYFRARYGGE